MFTRFMQALDEFDYGPRTKIDNFSPAVAPTSTDQQQWFLKATVVSGTPAITMTCGDYVEYLQYYGDLSGTIIVPFTTSYRGGAFTKYLDFNFGGATLDVKVCANPYNKTLVTGSSIGPMSISTKCLGAVYPFTVVFTAKPLFLNRVPIVTWYNGDTTPVTIGDMSGYVGGPEYALIDYAINRKIRLKLHYIPKSGDTEKVGLVDAITLSSGYTGSSSVLPYTLVGTADVVMPATGSQTDAMALDADPIIGAENPARYLRRMYVPTPAYTNSMEYLDIQPVPLTAGDSEIQTSGRVIFEQSNLYMGEAFPRQYIVTCNVLAGAGQVMINPDANQKFTELSEYEF